MGLVWTPNSSAPACWAIGWGEAADQPLFWVAISFRPGSERSSSVSSSSCGGGGGGGGGCA